jgi:5-methylcytosine-specific restriction protein B
VGEAKDGKEASLIKDQETMDSILNTLSHTKNLILYGPPGTGKTFFAKKVSEVLVRQGSIEGISEEARLQDVADHLTFHDLLALGMYLNNPDGRYTAPELQLLPIIQARYELSPVKHPNNQIWGYLQTHSTPESETVNISRRSEPFLFDKDDQSRWFLTNFGIQYITENLSEDLKKIQSQVKDVDIDDFIEWITFHQSYSYEEFIEGLRPVTSEEDPSIINYEVVPGAFKKIAKRAGADTENNYVIIIDEINRGNIIKIFGELISLIEDDKRAGEPNELKVALAYSPDGYFSVPSNLYLIGTMNTADRSIALLDAALRRRFAFQEIMPSPEILDDLVVESAEEAVNIGDLLRNINKKIIMQIDRDHQIGHSYFLKLKDVKKEEQPEVLEYIWNHQVFPLLREYFYSQPEELFELLQPMYDDEGMTKEDLMLGKSAFEFKNLSGDDLLYALSALAEV